MQQYVVTSMGPQYRTRATLKSGADVVSYAAALSAKGHTDIGVCPVGRDDERPYSEWLQAQPAGSLPAEPTRSKDDSAVAEVQCRDVDGRGRQRQRTRRRYG